MAFCDFCTCKDCQTGNALFTMHHAQTSDGRWICDVCYEYDECVRAKRKMNLRDGPCDDHNCSHRSKITSEWISHIK